MSIHIYSKNNVDRKSIFILPDEIYDILEGSFDTFEKRTGIFIDPYGKVLLYPDNLRLLSEIIRNDFPKTNTNTRNEAVELVVKQLDLLYQAGELVVFMGD